MPYHRKDPYPEFLMPQVQVRERAAWKFLRTELRY